MLLLQGSASLDVLQDLLIVGGYPRLQVSHLGAQGLSR